MTQAITWLIHASRKTGGAEGAIAFCQIPLEMLAWLVFVDDNPVLDHDGFYNLSAGNKLQILLNQCGIPRTVPPLLKTLLKVATRDEGTQVTGPNIATEIRNTIVHPSGKNREKFSSWVTGKNVKAEDLLRDTEQLFKWYVTLVLLRLMDYQGEYANRLVQRIPGTVEKVPWASNP